MVIIGSERGCQNNKTPKKHVHLQTMRYSKVGMIPFFKSANPQNFWAHSAIANPQNSYVRGPVLKLQICKIVMIIPQIINTQNYNLNSAIGRWNVFFIVQFFIRANGAYISKEKNWVWKSQIERKKWVRKYAHLRKVRKTSKFFKSTNFWICYLRIFFATAHHLL